MFSQLVTGSFREARMGGGAFILLKTGLGGRESAKQAEIRLASLLKILRIAGARPLETAEGHSEVVSGHFPPDMANSAGIAGSVIEITVFVRQPAQYSATECRLQIMKVSASASIRMTTSA